MKNFRFEYTVMKTLIFIAISGAILGILISVILPDITVFGLAIRPLAFILTIVICLVFYNNKYRKTGNATIEDSTLSLELNGNKQIIPFQNIESFRVYSGNGTILILNLRDQSGVKIVANKNFCKEGAFFEFCTELEKLLVAYNKTSLLPLKRLPSIFEHKWALPLLMTGTLLFFVMLVYIVSLHWNYQWPALAGFAVFGALWFAWFLAWIKKKRLEDWSD